ncbi:uncharacterized protein [Excalfactoria chinensis]|uniref:uncharacterized protein n=1 Tax=Excalfactoria chinensis TaxID=46218 RepID=UPI003B3BBEB8
MWPLIELFCKALHAIGSSVVMIQTYWAIIKLATFIYGAIGIYNRLKTFLEMLTWYLHTAPEAPKGATNITEMVVFEHVPRSFFESFIQFLKAQLTTLSIEFLVSISLNLLFIVLFISIWIYNILRKSSPEPENTEWQGVWRGFGEIFKGKTSSVSWSFTPEHLKNPESLIAYLRQECCGSGRSQEAQMIWGLAKAYRALFNTIPKSLRAERESLKADRESLRAERESLRAEKAEREKVLETEKESLRAERRSLRETVRKERESFQAKQKSLWTEKESLLAERNNLLRQREALWCENESLRVKGRNLLHQRDTYWYEGEALRNEKGSLQSKLNTLQSERDTLRSERDALQSERDTLWSERDALQSKLNTLQSECDTLQTKRSISCSEYNALQSEHNALQSERNTLQSERDTLQSERDTLRSERDALQSERDTLRSERDALQSERDTLRSERDALQSERDTLWSERDALQSKLDTLQSEHDALKSKHDPLQPKRDILWSEYNALQSEHNALQSERNTLRSERDALRSEYDALQSEHNILQFERNTLRSERDTLRFERDNLQTEYGAILFDRNSLRNHIGALQSMYDTLQSERDILESELNALRDGLQANLEGIKISQPDQSQGAPDSMLVAPVRGRKTKRVSTQLEQPLEVEEQRVIEEQEEAEEKRKEREGELEEIEEIGEEEPRIRFSMPEFLAPKISNGGSSSIQLPPSTPRTPGRARGEEKITTLTDRSLKLSEIRDLRKDYARQPKESIAAWLLRCWDNGANSVWLDGNEARQLGSVSRDSRVDRGIGTCQDESYTLWTRMLLAVKERFPLKQDLTPEEKKWTDIETGIRYLRERAVVEMLYSPNFRHDDPNQLHDPETVRVSRLMWRAFTRTAPREHASALAIIYGTGAREPPVSELIDKIHGIELFINTIGVCISAVIKGLDKVENTIKRLDKVEDTQNDIIDMLTTVPDVDGSMMVQDDGDQDSHDNLTGKLNQARPSRPVSLKISTIKKRRLRVGANDNSKVMRFALLFFLRSQGEDIKKWSNSPTSALQARVKELQRKSVIKADPSRRGKAPVAASRRGNQ